MKNTKYPTINYIGNKQKIANWIVDSFPIKKGSVLDLFCGGSSVSYKLKQRGFIVYSNDILFSNFCISKSLIENGNVTLKFSDFNNFQFSQKQINKKIHELNFLSNKIYFANEIPELAHLVLISEKLKGYKKYIFLSLLRRSMIRKMPYSRMNLVWEQIKKFRNEEYCYKKYKRNRHYYNVNFINHILDNLNEFNTSIFDNNHQNKAYHDDAFELLKKINKVDAIYLDPPYPFTMNDYDAFYGAFDKMFFRDIKPKLDLKTKKNFSVNFEKIIKIASKKTNFLIISLNNHSFPCINIINILTPYIDSYKILSKNHTYKISISRNKTENSKEILIICKCK